MILRLADYSAIPTVTTIDLQWHSAANQKYILTKGTWAPRVAQLDSAVLGGRSPYRVVEEQIEFMACGQSEAEVLTNLYNVWNMLDKAARWRREETPYGVVLQYQPSGGQEVLEAAIVGPVSSEAEFINLPVTFNNRLNMFVSDPVAMRLLRRGQWLTMTVEDATASAASNTGTVMSNTFTTYPVGLSTNEIDVLSPLFLRLDGFPAGVATASWGQSLLMQASSLYPPQAIEAEGAANAGVYTSVNDAANFASGNNVLRYTPGVTTFVASNILTSVVVNRGVTFWAVVRNNSATTTWQIRLRIGEGTPTISRTIATTTPVLLDASSTQPRLLYLGTLFFGPGLANPNVAFEIAASAASGTMDIDVLAVNDTTRPDSNTLLLDAIDNTTTASVANLHFDTGAGYKEPLAGTVPPAVRPSLYMSLAFPGLFGGSPAQSISYRGNAFLVTKQISLRTLFLCTRGAHWRLTNATPALVTLTMNARRRRAMLIPR